MKTLIIIILDESGSMGAKKTDVIGGFNTFLNDQKLIKNDEARLYLVKFNTVVCTVHKGVELELVPELTVNNYNPGGQTALYDAIGEGIRIAEKDKTEDERVICVIMTDGEENSSKETTKDQVKQIISNHEAKDDWTFLYIGENPERWTKETGMPSDHGIHYDHKDPKKSYGSANQALSAYRSSDSKKGKNLFDNA